MKRIIFTIIACLLLAGFIIFPFFTADIHIRVYFDDILGDECVLYYMTDTSPDFSEDKCIIANVDGEAKVDFRLDAALDGHITGLRIDWPTEDQLICVKNIAVSSGGIIQKEFDPCYFFAADNIASMNSIPDMSLIHARKRAYIMTSADDPYMIMSAGLTEQIQGCYSHYRLTRLAICIFVFGCFFFWKKGFFTSEWRKYE